MCKSISGSCMEAAHPPTSASASVSHSQSEDAPPTADIGWALKKTKKSVHFIEGHKNIQWILIAI